MSEIYKPGKSLYKAHNIFFCANYKFAVKKLHLTVKAHSPFQLTHLLLKRVTKKKKSQPLKKNALHAFPEVLCRLL